ncbi:MAG: glycosyltransferase [Treponema sp.]|jgi:glycosyltransferase involved in cell wall biosynthesis|nr:glycosyltransferase [Treponema sp.]
MKVSIIIPALNEEQMLPRLLDSIKVQDFDDYEVIVADAHSKDRTREIAAEYGCRVVDGGLPAAGRNAGASAACGDFLFFLDADVVLPQGFIRNVYDEMQDRYFDLATCEIRPLSDYRLDRIIHRMMNLAVLLNLWLDPKAFGFCIFVTRRLFERVGGFDETIYVAEDNDFVKRASMFKALRYLNSAYIMVSIRRFEKEGRFAYMKKGIKLNLYRAFKGEIRSSEVVKYEFDAFNKPESPEDLNLLDTIEKHLIKAEEKSRRFSRRAQKQSSATASSIRQFQPSLDEYAHLIEELDEYLGRKEQREQRQQKLRDFFKPHRSSAQS